MEGIGVGWVVVGGGGKERSVDSEKKGVCGEGRGGRYHQPCRLSTSSAETDTQKAA